MVYVAGDFNINLLAVNDTQLNSDYFDSILAAGYLPTITLPTRLSQNSTLIDNILTNNLKDFTAVVLGDHISDHQAIIVSADTELPRRPEKYVTIRSKDEQSKIKFCETVAHMNVASLLYIRADVEPNNNYAILENSLKTAMDKSFTVKRVKFNRRKHKITPWITFDIIRAINERNKLYRKLKRTNVNNQSYHNRKVNFNAYKTTLGKTITAAKKLYYTNLFARHQNDLKKTWAIISETLHKNKRSLIPEIMLINNVDFSDKQTIVDEFNKLFTSSLEANLNVVHHHSQNYTDYFNRNVLSNFEFHEINDDITKKIIHELKSSRSSGHDGLNSELLKLISNDISNAITIIVNQSIKSGIFPTKLKIAKAMPIYKKRCKKLQTNYRPISVLPTISKILERVISDQLTQYFYDHKLFSEQQYGYRKNSSTEIAALQLIDRLVRQLDQRDIPINFYLDLSKAFDCIIHKILATKL